MSRAGLLAELETAVTSGTPEKRVETLRRVTGLFLSQSDQLNEHQISVFDDVLVHLIQRIETKALIQLSKSLAPVDNAPIAVIRHLSRHDEITVAGPVLTHSNRLSEDELVDIAKNKSQGHMLAISGRLSLPETVTDVLVERGNMEVHYSLARNSNARFSESGFATLVQKSKNDDKLTQTLGLRLDIPLNLLRKLLARASELVRSKLLALASPEHQQKIKLALESVVNEVGREAIGRLDIAQAYDLVCGMNRRGELNEAALVEFVKDGKYEEMVAALALFCGVKPDLTERLSKSMRHDGLVLACKAAKLSWSTTDLVLRKRFAHHSPSAQELAEARSSFLALSQKSAERSMRFMNVQAQALRNTPICSPPDQR